MCQLCVDAIEKYWPDLPEDQWHELLVGATAYPCSDGEETARQVKEMAEISGCDLGLAIAIAEAEIDVAMAQGKLDGLLEEGRKKAQQTEQRAELVRHEF